MMAPRPAVPERQWRVTEDGQLEHATLVTPKLDENREPQSPTYTIWAQVLAEEPVRFHAVAAIGNQVWAGGAGGALFHSTDGGQHWNKVALHDERSTIVSIRFDDPQHGVVKTEAGSRWSTSDGGMRWSQEP